MIQNKAREEIKKHDEIKQRAMTPPPRLGNDRSVSPIESRSKAGYRVSMKDQEDALKNKD